MGSVQDILMKFIGSITSIYAQSRYVQAIVIVALLFLLVVSLAQFRQHFVKWSFKGGLVGLFFGFIFALLLEGFLLVSGHTVVTTLLGWKNAPKPISTALDLGKDKLINVLGTTNEDAISTLQRMNPDEIKKIKAIICTP